jgi:putative flippase GtrA
VRPDDGRIARLGNNTFRQVAGESARYFAASAAAFTVDFAAYVALIRLAEWHYLLAAPAGFALGLLAAYVLSIRWVFATRRVKDARLEFFLFAAIGLLGMAVNEAVLYGSVGHAGVSPELAKVVSAAVVFTMNFALRKALLFTHFGAP